MPPQLKSPADIGLLVIVNGAFPVLVNVESRIGLVWPTVTLPKLMLVGFSVRMPAVAVTVTVAPADLVLSATLVAVTVTVFVAITMGAVNSPVVLTVPEVADQVTAVLLVFVTWAENCAVPPEATVAVVGETETLIAAVGVVKTLSRLVTSTPVESADSTR
jgi:hypothetical protein